MDNIIGKTLMMAAMLVCFVVVIVNTIQPSVESKGKEVDQQINSVQVGSY